MSSNKGKKQAAGEAAASKKVAMTQYKEARAGSGPSAAREQAKMQSGRAGAQLRGAYKSQRSPFMRALASRQGTRGVAQMQSQNLGQLASVRAQEQSGRMGSSMGHYFGQSSQMGAHQASQQGVFQEFVMPVVGAAATAASGMI